MTTESRQWPPETVRRLAELTRDSVEAQLRLGREYGELMRSSLSGPPDAETGRAYLESVRRESERYWRELAELGLSYASELVGLSTRASSAVLHDLRDVARRSGTGPASGHDNAPGDDPEDGGPAGDAAIRLSGSLGETVSGEVTLVNRHPRARRISLSAAPLTDRSGSVVAASIELAESGLTVPAGEEATVAVRLRLDPQVFAAGQEYRTVIEVSGGVEASVPVLVRVAS